MKPARITALVLCICFVGTLAGGEDSRAPGAPSWRPGFPMRAGGTVFLFWTPVAGAQTYVLRRKTGDGDFREIYRGTGTMYSDTAAPSDVTLAYRVAALRDGNESAPSPPAILRAEESIKPPEVTGAITDRLGAISIRWTIPPGAAYFNVYRALSEGGPYTKVASLASNTFVDSKVDKDKVYYYRISAVDRFGKESGQSRPLNASLSTPSVGTDTGKPVLRMVKFLSTFRGEDRYPLEQPSEIGIAAGGELFVLERRGIQFFDPDGNYLHRLRFAEDWGSAGWAMYDHDGTLLLSFHSDQVVRMIDNTGKQTGEIRYPPAVPGMRNNPNGVAVDERGHYWILDGMRAQVIETDNKTEPLRILGRLPGTYDLKDRRVTDLPSATKIYRNPKDGILYVVLGASSEIKAIDPGTGSVLRTFGGLGTGTGHFQAIGGIAFRGNGNLLILDSLAQTVKEFDRDRNIYVATYADVVENNRIRLSSNLPTAIAWTEENRRLYVVSSLLNVVYIFDLPK